MDNFYLRTPLRSNVQHGIVKFFSCCKCTRQYFASSTKKLILTAISKNITCYTVWALSHKRVKGGLVLYRGYADSFKRGVATGARHFEWHDSLVLVHWYVKLKLIYYG